MITSVPAKNQTFTSKKGVPVTFVLSFEKDVEHIKTAEIKYGNGGKGRAHYYPCVPRLHTMILESINNFISDTTGLAETKGQQLVERKENRIVLKKDKIEKKNKKAIEKATRITVEGKRQRGRPVGWRKNPKV